MSWLFGVYSSTKPFYLIIKMSLLKGTQMQKNELELLSLLADFTAFVLKNSIILNLAD